MVAAIVAKHDEAIKQDICQCKALRHKQARPCIYAYSHARLPAAVCFSPSAASGVTWLRTLNIPRAASRKLLDVFDDFVRFGE